MFAFQTMTADNKTIPMEIFFNHDKNDRHSGEEYANCNEQVAPSCG